MGSNKLPVNKLTEDAILKFPEMSKSAIARYLHATHPLHFNSIENARSMIRKLTGAQGDSRRHYKQTSSKYEVCLYPFPVLSKYNLLPSPVSIIRLPALPLNNRIL